MTAWYLGINWEQNSTAALFQNTTPVGCISEERFTRIKNDERYPINSINYLLKSNSLTSEDLDAVCFVSTMWNVGYVLTRHYSSFSIKDYIQEQKEIWYPRIYENNNSSSITDIFPEKLDLQQFPGEQYWNQVLTELKGDSLHVSSENSEKIGQRIRREVVMLHLGIPGKLVQFMDHSSSHACYAYYATTKIDDQEPALALTLDAFGDNVNYSARVFSKRKEGKRFRADDQIICKGDSFIIGRLYRYITLILGLKPNEHEYKVMGLAPYSKKHDYLPVLNIFHKFQFVEGVHFVNNRYPKDMFFQIKELLEGYRFDAIAGALQVYTEELITRWVSNCVNTSSISKICLAGGVGMNIKANMLISQMEEVGRLRVPPSPDDSSQAMGAVYAYLHEEQENPAICNESIYPISSPYLGQTPGSAEDIESIVKSIDESKYQITQEDTIECAVNLLLSKQIIGRIAGREEFGARALGNRSILADPRDHSIKKSINEKIKNRDWWMPFACTVLEDHADDFFELTTDSENYGYMTIGVATSERGVNLLPAGLHPYDETCRPQILCRGVNPGFEELIIEFGKKSGVYGLLNTSLNLHGMPIVSTLCDALEVLERSDLDALIFENILIRKL